MDERKLLPHQIAQVMIGSTTGVPPVEVFRTDEMIIEAPNWTIDGRWLILNGDGKLWRLAADGSSGLELIDLSDVPDLNNDHVLSPDGRHVFVSANDWHVYEADLAGGAVRRVTNDHAPSSSCTSSMESAPTGKLWPTSGSSPRVRTGGREPTSS